MAAARNRIPAWEVNSEVYDDFIDDTPYMRQLETAITDFQKKLHLDKIWCHLLRLQALEMTDIERIQGKPARPDQAFELVRFFFRGTERQYHALMRALALTGQHDLIPANREMYMVDLPQSHATQSARLEGPSVFTPRLLQAIWDHIQYCERTLKRTHVFDFEGDPSAQVMDVTKCFINVKAWVKNASSWQQSKRSSRRWKQDDMQEMRLIPIGTDEILEAFGGTSDPHSIKLEGHPGDGKTSYAKNVVRTWSKKFGDYLRKTSDGITLLDGHPKWTTMVFLRARDIKTSVEQAIRDALGCKEEDLHLLMEHIKRGQGIAIITDAIDELRDKGAIEKLKAFVHDCQKPGRPTVLVTCRTNLCSIDAKDFDRFLQLSGFDDQQAFEYVKRYTENCQATADHVKPSTVMDFVKRNQVKMSAILCNPLRLHIFCALAVKGRITLEDGTQDFDIPNLLGPLERYLLFREGIEGISVEQSMHFYRLCLYVLLQRLNEFPESLLKDFSVDPCFHVFLKRTEKKGDRGKLETHYTFSHEMVLEYLASRCIYGLCEQDRNSLLLLMCSDINYRNVQKIIFQLLQQEKSPNAISAKYGCAIDHIHELLRECTPDLKSIIGHNTIHRLLPCKDPDDRFEKIFPVASASWASVEFDSSDDEIVEAGCPSDAAEAITQQGSKSLRWFTYKKVNTMWYRENNKMCSESSKPHQATSKEEWGKFLQAMCMTFTGNSINFHLNEETPLSGLLDSLSQNPAYLSDSIDDIFILGGREEVYQIIRHVALTSSRISLSVNVTHHFISDLSAMKIRNNVNSAVEIQIEDKSPLFRLLSYLAQYAEHISHCRVIDIVGGKINVDDLNDGITLCKDAGISLRLRPTNIVIPHRLTEEADALKTSIFNQNVIDGTYHDNSRWLKEIDVKQFDRTNMPYLQT